MNWVLEQDVLYMLLHSMGRIPSLAEALDLAEEDVAVDRLRIRALELKVAEQKGAEFDVDPNIRSLLRIACDASEIIGVIGATKESADGVVRYYYIGPGGLVVVERESERLLLRKISKEKAAQEITSLIGLGEAKPDSRPVVVPIAPSGESPASLRAPEEMAEFLQLIRVADLWWILRLSKGQIQEILFVMARGERGWVLQQQQDQTLAMSPVNHDDVRTAVGEVFSHTLGAQTK